ncbi:MAG: hypothetical protein H7842_10575 [Gammaproteobacteria bacterium SHHR-1]|uniref:hypothetical protein n=1 Tax=Magnetovirga frankeli TaxID=947516 RepID=UPI001AF90982|nr:hypothetical protein D5125_12050 [gamma proteobacterium SS-5]
MRLLIAQIRQAIPFDAPQARICAGPCASCSLKLLEYLEAELDSWELRLAQGERPGLAELSRLAKSARRIQRALHRNGLLDSHTPLAGEEEGRQKG